MADRKTIEHGMIFELLTIKDFFSHFDDGYCVEIPSDKTKLDDLLNYLSAQDAVWKFYATLTNGYWFHGIYITFQKKTLLEAETIMLCICKILKIDSFGLCEGCTLTVINTDGDIIAFSDFAS